MSAPIVPGSTIGILGGGQLGRMLALAARPMGYGTVVLDPTPGCPAAQVADQQIVAPFDDEAAIDSFCQACDVATVEFENIPAPTLERVAERIPLRPDPHLVHRFQNRQREKTWLRAHGIPCPDFAVVTSAGELAAAVHKIGTPCVLKTADFGYDGKGQVRLTDPGTDWASLWASRGAEPGVVETWVPYTRELSVLCARNPSGETVVYDPGENIHRDHILDTTTVPAQIPPGTAAHAMDLARTLAGELGYVGVLGIELFLLGDGTLLVNELAPRTHNSGHHTIEAARTSQFQNQVRAVCGLPLGPADLVSPASMANLLGDLWTGHPHGSPDWAAALAATPSASLHLYGKARPAPKRKMGHLTVLAPDPAAARDAVLRARTAASPPKDR